MDEKIDTEIRWDDLSAFLAVAKGGGLSAAAREIGYSAPTLGRRMRQLERAMSQELFVRRTHGYDLTEAGQTLRRELESIAGKIERLTKTEARNALPLVKLSAGTWTSLHLARRANAVAGSPPDVRLRFIASEDLLNINRREAAIGLRNRRPTEAGLAGRKLKTVEFAPYAIDGAPSHWIAVAADTPSARWLIAQHAADILHEVSHPRLALDMAMAGFGRVVLPTFIGQAEPGLTRCGPVIRDLSHEQWLVTHDDDRALPEVRRIIDRIVEILG